MNYQTYKVTLENHIATVAFNRPEKANCLNQKAWDELQTVFEDMDANPEVRVIVLMGEGKHFCAGIDIAMLMELASSPIKCEGRKREFFLQKVSQMQENISAIEKCRKPVLAAIDNACLGAGVDIITACDMRYGTEKSYYSIKEIDWGMVADIGTLQRLPKIINSGVAAELAFTGRQFDGKEAHQIGLLNNTFTNKKEMMEHVMEVAKTIASKSPLSIRGIKKMLLYTRDHSVNEALKYQGVWNAAMIISDDLMEAATANMMKRKANFES